MEKRLALFERALNWCRHPVYYHWAHNKEYYALDADSLVIIKEFLQPLYPEQVSCPENLSNDQAAILFEQEIARLKGT